MLARLACGLLKRGAVRRLFNNRVVIIDYPLNSTPRWRNGNADLAVLLDRPRATFCALWFPPIDAVALMSFIARQKPRTYFEVGSGHSTIVARHTINALGLDTRIISVDQNHARVVRA